MSKLAMAVGVAILLMGVTIVVSPDLLLALTDWGSQGGLYIKAVMAVVTGAVLILAAQTSKFPNVFRVLGGFGMLAGLVLPLIPIDFWAEWVHYWTVENVTLYRVVGGPLGILEGAFITYAALPERDEAERATSA